MFKRLRWLWVKLEWPSMCGMPEFCGEWMVSDSWYGLWNWKELQRTAKPKGKGKYLLEFRPWSCCLKYCMGGIGGFINNLAPRAYETLLYRNDTRCMKVPIVPSVYSVFARPGFGRKRLARSLHERFIHCEGAITHLVPWPNQWPLLFSSFNRKNTTVEDLFTQIHGSHSLNLLWHFVLFPSTWFTYRKTRVTGRVCWLHLTSTSAPLKVKVSQLWKKNVPYFNSL